MLRMGLSEAMKGPVQIDVIGYYEAPGTQNSTHLLELEAGVVFRVDTIVKEEIDRLKPSE